MSNTKFKIKIKIKGIKTPGETERDPYIGRYFTYLGEGDKPTFMWKILKKDSHTGYYFRSKIDNLDAIEIQYSYTPGGMIKKWSQVTDLTIINNFRKRQLLKPEKYIN